MSKKLSLIFSAPVANNEPWKHMWGLYQMLESCSIRLSTDTYLAVMFAAVKVSSLGEGEGGVGP